MEKEKKKKLIRRLTMISIPFVFVAIPSLVIFVGSISPHTAAPDGAAKIHSVSMLNKMTGGQMVLCCGAISAGNWEFLHYFILDPYDPQHVFFRPPPGPYAVLCKWGYLGNFLQDVVVFDSSAPYAPLCRVEEGGCRYVFEDGRMYRVTGRKEQRDREKALVGDLLLTECRHLLWVFPVACRPKPHDNQYVGRVINRWQWWFNY